MGDAGRSRPKLLVAECDRESADILALKLRHVIACDVLSTTSGDEALALFGRHEPDMVLLCLKLHPSSGREALRRIRASGAVGRSVPVVGLGTCSMQDEIEAASAWGFDRVLPGATPGVEALRELLERVLVWPRPRATPDASRF